jgi:peptidoglycan-associated lipoprotein
MKTKLLISSLFATVLLTTGCGGKTAVVDETKGGNDNSTPVHVDTAGAKGTDNGSVTKDITGDNTDANVQQMNTAETEMQSIYFDYDKFSIRADMQEIIENNAQTLNKSENKALRVKIEGNCDEWGSDEYNYALGLKRANGAKKALMAQGFDGARVTLVSLGEANPTCTEKTKECWSKNRRVDFKFLP